MGGFSPEDLRTSALAATVSPEEMRRMYERKLGKHEKHELEITKSLIHAMEYGTTGPRPVSIRDVKHALTERIEQHKKMIKTLEWFGAHLGLDSPEEDTLVGRVIWEGLQVMREKMKQEG